MSFVAGNQRMVAPAGEAAMLGFLLDARAAEAGVVATAQQMVVNR